MNSMKKYMMAVALMVLAVMAAVAQDIENPVGKISVIPRIGVVLSNWSNNKIYFTTEENADYMKSKYQAGFMGGVDFEYRATEQVGISLGAYYAKQGFRWPHGRPLSTVPALLPQHPLFWLHNNHESDSAATP